MNLERFLDKKLQEIANYGKVKVHKNETLRFCEMVMDNRLGMMHDLVQELEKHDKGKAQEIVDKWRKAFHRLEEAIVFGNTL